MLIRAKGILFYNQNLEFEGGGREQMRLGTLLISLAIVIMFSNSCSKNQSEQTVAKITKETKIPKNDAVDLKHDLKIDQTHSLKFELTEGNIDGYWIRLPYQHNKHELWPVIVYFHGAGLLEADVESIRDVGPASYAIRDTSQVGDLRDQIFSNFIIITPHLKGTGEENPSLFPSWTKEFKTIDAILDTVLNEYSGNEEKIYLTGLSLGGAASWLLPNYLESPIAAVVPVCGSPAGYYGTSDPRPKEKTSSETFDKFSAGPFRIIPVWNTCNARDGWPHRVFQETAVKSIEALGGEKFLRLATAKPLGEKYLKHKRIFTSFDKSGHDAWNATYRNIHIYKWMLTITNQGGEITQEN